MENDDSPSKTWDNNSDRVIGTTKRSMTCVAILVDGSIGSTRNVGSRVRRMQVAMVDKDLMWVGPDGVEGKAGGYYLETRRHPEGGLALTTHGGSKAWCRSMMIGRAVWCRCAQVLRCMFGTQETGW